MCRTTSCTTRPKIAERTGVTPRQYPEFAALRGDPSDNLPGVPGVGEKTAAKLINTYGDLETIYAHLDDLTPTPPRVPGRRRAFCAQQRHGDASRA